MQTRSWTVTNVAATAVCLGWLGVDRATTLAEVSLLPTALVGLLWGALQWQALRDTPLRASGWWMVATAVGWLLALPFTLFAINLIPQSSDDFAGFVANFDLLLPLPFRLSIGIFLTLAALAFFGLLAGVPLALAQWLLLRVGERRALATPWLGNAAWGWTLGLFCGGLVVTILVTVATAVLPALTFPFWLVLALLGAVAGVVYALLTHHLL